MATSAAPRSTVVRNLLTGWGRLLTGYVPLLSIEITRECPLSCPGCYAYGDNHLGGDVTLRELADYRGDALVNGVINLVRQHKPMHVSLVGGEPLIRHRELSRILPELDRMGVLSMVVTSGVIPIPAAWMEMPSVRVAVSIDGLPEHHDIRRKPATYERILKNIEGCFVNIHLTITRQMLSRPGYLEEYAAFWSARPEINCILVSVYTPQVGEESAEKLKMEDRVLLAQILPELKTRYPKIQFNKGMGEALVHPPENPGDCLFAKMSVNYSADLKSRVEPCVFGGQPDCSQCGCAISTGLHWIRGIQMAGPAKIDHVIQTSLNIGKLANRLRFDPSAPSRWTSGGPPQKPPQDLVQIQP
ncbi:MAG TPA: radical SAM protein [Candidatus Acidoferrum sp.]|nr:radical SAM protein [Candidatus Acidoferrum sp.]